MSNADIYEQTQSEDFDIEACEEINQAEARGTTATRGEISVVNDVPGCTTSVVNRLSEQLIYQMNLIMPNVLVSFDDLNVELQDAVWPFLQAPAKQALAQAIQERGEVLTINSAYRTLPQQFLLYSWGSDCSPRVAPVGKSNHQGGLAIDVPDHEGWQPYLEKYGWQWFGDRDPVHFDYEGEETQDIRSATILAFQQLWNKNHPNDKIDEDGDYGNDTAEKLGNSPVNGFSKAPWDDHPRDLRLSRPIMQGSDVLKVQEALVKVSFTVKTDGSFGKDTDVAVKQFQQKNGLKPDGIVGSVTREKLFKAST